MAKQSAKKPTSEISNEKLHPFESGNIISRQEAAKFEMVQADHKMRMRLSMVLGIISVSWLVFTAFVIIALATRPGWFSLSDPVAIAFLTQSLGTVLGLWGIGLKYYFKK